MNIKLQDLKYIDFAHNVFALDCDNNDGRGTKGWML